MTRHLMWVNEEEGWIAFQYKVDGLHHHYEYLQLGENPLTIRINEYSIDVNNKILVLKK